MIGQIILETSNLSKLVDTLLISVTHFTFLCKLSNFSYFSANLLIIEDQLIDNFTENEMKILRDRTKSADLIGKIFRWLCIFSLFAYIIMPFLTNPRRLPFPGWLPYDIDKYFYQTHFFQIISIAISAYNNSTIDILTWKLITIASAQLQVLCDNLQNILYQFDNANAQFKQCLKHYSKIIT